MKKHLALAAAIGMLAFSGCAGIQDDSLEDINDSSANTVSLQQDKDNQSGEESNQAENTNTLSIAELEEMKVNELGEIMVLMYHNIGHPESTWQRTPENFKRDLEELYSRGFRPIRLIDYVNGNIKVDAGFTPVVITFDDGNENNFRYVENENGELEIDPDCALGVMANFNKEHPDFNATATFFINANPFGNDSQAESKLKFLVKNGYDIGNHTLGHIDLSKASADDSKEQIAAIVDLVGSHLPEYEVNTLALPFGGVPGEENKDAVCSGSVNETSYENKCLLRVGWDPYKSPFHKDFDALSVHRVRASETNVDNVGMYDWLERYEDGKRTRYISDGDPSTITIPDGYRESLSDGISGKKIITY